VTDSAVTVCDAIADVDASEWNKLSGTECPFLQHDFLLAAEQSGSAVAETGWRPRHLVLRTGGKLAAAMPLYEKTHSWGEFVFDWAWAQAYEQAGISYYPKLVSALPFTPASSRRILLRDPADVASASALLHAAIELAEDTGCSSLHVLLPAEDELSALTDCGFRLRKDCQFHWHNRNYDTFEDFLGSFSSAKRKKVRRERRRVAEAGITFRHLRGSDIDAALWTTLYRLIGMTFVKRGSLPYFNLDFFRQISQTMPDRLLVILAERHAETIAGAVFFESSDTLYGRYWGANGHYDALHFETCYYQGIEHCIASGLQVFEPGTQGEHKISRGFVPAATWSAHWLKHPQFFSAIGNYLREEREHIDRYMTAVDGHSPYRSDLDETR
jgi:predicted N-acyltransferase